jgi:predicted PurR-regulated permease PerM
MRGFYLIGGVLTLGLIVWILSPFAAVLTWAAILATAAHPIHTWLLRLVGGRETLAAALSTLAVVLVILGPALGLVFQITNEAIGMYQDVEPRLRASLAEGPAPLLLRMKALPLAGPLVERLDRQFKLSALNLRSHAMDLMRRTASGLAAFTGGLLRNVLGFLLDAVVLLLALTVLFRDGPHWVQASRHWLPMLDEDRLSIVRDLRQATRAILYGMFLTALVQGALAGIGYQIAGLPSPLLLASATAVAALVPIGGTVLVWLPASLVLFAQGRTAWGIFLLLWGALVVMTIDNFLKPIFIGGGTRLPLLWVFLGILGGITAFGFLGLFLGPLALVFGRAFLQLARRELLPLLAAAEGSPPRQ